MELEFKPNSMVTTKLKLPALDPRDKSRGPPIGIEIIYSLFASWEVKPLALTRAEAQRLAQELTRAAQASTILTGR